MDFNFDEIIDRTGTHCEKWDGIDCELPMWVADMDFKAAPCIRDAIAKRLEHGVFGYSFIPDEWYDAYISWWGRRHHFDMEKDWLMFCNGVIPAISSIVRKVTSVAENVLILTPIYNNFFNSIQNNGRNPIESPLLYDGSTYSIDWIDFESKLANPQTSLLLFCNPQNPGGIIWDKETLIKIGQLCQKYGVIVLSDEIHCDLTDPSREYIPFASVSDTNRDISITCIAPSKCFNIAGLNSSAIVVPDPYLRHKVWRGINTDEVAEPNAFAVEVAIAAFNEGEEWLNSLNEYIYENKKLVIEYIALNIPQIRIVPSDATYLLWIDCSKVCKDSKKLTAHIRKRTGLFVSNGKQYGEGGQQFIRLNIACPKDYVMDGLKRLKDGIETYEM